VAGMRTGARRRGRRHRQDHPLLRAGRAARAVPHLAGYRDYSQGPARLAFIRAAQAASLSLAEIREILAIRDHGQPSCTHVTRPCSAAT
jgi:hypothetical protein